MHEEIAEYYKHNVHDPERMSTAMCIKKGLPYIDEKGQFKNTHKFCLEADGFIKNRMYTNHAYGSKDWVDYWSAQHERKRKGYWLGQLRISGHFYMFLNFYRMRISDGDSGEEMDAFPNFWVAHFWVFHLIEYADYVKSNIALIKPRGCGLSEAAASIGVFDCQVPDLDKNGNRKFNRNFYTASDSDYLGGADGIFSKITEAIIWLNKNTGEGEYCGIYQPYKHTMDNTKLHWVAGKRDDNNLPVQTGGSVKATVINKPDDIRGGRSRRVFCEESGANAKLGKTLTVGEPLTKRGRVKTGIVIIWGTSNEDSRGIKAFKRVLMNPYKYDCLQFKNVWRDIKLDDPESVLSIPQNPFEILLPKETDEVGVGYFIPTYSVAKLDKDGNPDLLGGLKELLAERQKKLRGESLDENQDILALIADAPVTMEEALTISKGKYFSSPELARQIVNIETRLTTPKIYKGDLSYIKDKDGNIIGVDWWENVNGKIHIREHPKWSKQDVQIRERRIVSLSEEKPWRLYIGGIDSIDQGTGDSTSKGSELGCLIKKRRSSEDGLDPYANSYVAMYKNRSKDPRDDYENVLKILLYFNAVSLLEYTKLRIKDYIVSEQGFGKFLAEEPSAPGAEIKNYKRKRGKKGIRVPIDVIMFYLNLITEYTKDHYDKLEFLPLLKQIQEYEIEHKTKFDLIAAMGMCEILDAEFREVLPTTTEKVVKRSVMKWHIDPYTKRKKFGPVEEVETLYHQQNKIPKYLDHKKGKLIT